MAGRRTQGPLDRPNRCWFRWTGRLQGPRLHLDRDEGTGDKLRVLDLATGKELWSHSYEAPGKFMFGGSRTTPTLDGNLVYTVGPLGDLHAIDIATHKPAWRKNIWKDFGGSDELPRWAIVQNPLIYNDLLIVAPQTSQAGVVAYDKRTGEVKWKSAAFSGVAGYVTPSVVKVAGEDQLVMISAAVGRGRNARDGSVNGLDPRTGKIYSHYTINERSDGLVAMGMDGKVKWKTDQQPPFVRGGSILADGLMLATDGNTKLYLIDPFHERG